MEVPNTIEVRVSKSINKMKDGNLCDMADEDIGHLLNEDEMKLLRIARRQRLENTGRDLCKEAKDKEEAEKQKQMDTLTQRNQLLETWARDQEAKQKKLERDMEKIAGLLSQLISKQ